MGNPLNKNINKTTIAKNYEEAKSSEFKGTAESI